MAHKTFLMILFLCSFIVRALLFMYFTRHGTNAWIYVDSDQYHTIALNIANGDGICMQPLVAQYYRLPGYPLFLAACYRLFGKSVEIALWIQIFLSCFIPLVIFFLSMQLCKQRLMFSCGVALYCAIHPGLVLYAGMLATESLTVLFLLLFFVFFLGDEQSHWWLYMVAGCCLGIVSLLRPVGHYVLIISLLIMLWRQQSIKKFVHNALVLASSWFIVVAPWLVRNFLLTGSLFFHSLPGLHFVQYLATPIVMQQQNCLYPNARAQVLQGWQQAICHAEKIQQKKLNEYQQCCLGEKLTWSYVMRYPWYACKHMATEIFKTVFGLYSAIILLADGAQWPDYGPQVTWWQKVKRFLVPQVQRPLLVGFIYFDIITLIFNLIGCCLLLIRAVYDKIACYTLTFIFPYIALFIGLTLAYGGARLRLPIEPLLMLGAWYGWFG